MQRNCGCMMYAPTCRHHRPSTDLSCTSDHHRLQTAGPLTSESRPSAQSLLIVRPICTTVWVSTRLTISMHILTCAGYSLLTIEHDSPPTIIHPQLSPDGWPLRHSISRYDDQSLVVRNIATKLQMHDVCSDLQTSSTID